MPDLVLFMILTMETSANIDFSPHPLHLISPFRPLRVVGVPQVRWSRDVGGSVCTIK